MVGGHVCLPRCAPSRFGTNMVLRDIFSPGVVCGKVASGKIMALSGPLV